MMFPECWIIRPTIFYLAERFMKQFISYNCYSLDTLFESLIHLERILKMHIFSGKYLISSFFKDKIAIHDMLQT